MSGEDPVIGRYGSGHAVRRIEDPALVQGQGRFTDDLNPPGLLHAVFVRSSYAHGELRRIDADEARALPGVRAVLTGADLVAAGVEPLPTAPAFMRPDGSPMASPPKHALAVGRVRYAGEPVALVVAETLAAARTAAATVWADIDELPSVTDPRRAVSDGAPVLCDAAPDNVCARLRHGDAAAVEAAFARAVHRVELDVVNQRLAPSPLEPRCVLAAMDGERLSLWMSTQMPSGIRTSLAAALDRSVESIRVQVGDVGGGFGMKTGIHVEDLAVAFAATQLKAPVKWAAERLEDFLSAVHGRDQLGRAELALDEDGRVLALRSRMLANVGAYPSGSSVAIPLMVGPWVATSVYDIPAVDLEITAVLTNRAATGAYRGAGRPESIYLVERLMDAAARRLKLDPTELRRRNLIRPDQMPYRNAMAQTYDCGEFEKMLDQALTLADWAGYAARADTSRAAGRLRGRSVTTFLEWTGGGALQESVTVHVRGDGLIELVSATMAMGQGIATSYAQLAVDVFGLPIERIRVLQGDTDRANGFGSAGSRSLFTGGAAVAAAARRSVDDGKALAAQALEAPPADIEYRAGRFSVAGTDLGIGLFELAARQAGGSFSAEDGATAGAPSWPNAAHVCEVEIDPATGEVAIVAYTSVNDIGRVVSPAIVQGQIEGGAVQGIGQALCEQVVYDDAGGQMQSASLMDYALPRVDGFRGFVTRFDTSVPCTTNALGVKGVGELGTIGATPAVVNAVIDALAAAGHAEAAEALQMPLTAEKVWRVLQPD